MSNITADSFIRDEQDGTYSLHLLVDGLRCAGCVASIERALKQDDCVLTSRLNLSTKRLRITWKGAKETGERFIRTIQEKGYQVVPFDPKALDNMEKREEKFLLHCLAVAGFASGNLMLFSIPLWTSDGIEMGEATRTLFQWIQAVIAVPVILYAGQPFFRSAWKMLKKRRTNMDVPISVAVILTSIMSMFETLTHGKHAYFDSAVMLLFFLLIGRYLEARAKGKARSAAHDLLQMMTGFATVKTQEGASQVMPRAAIKEGMVLEVSVGERIGADGTVLEGTSDIDTSLITGESLPCPVQKGSQVFAGTLNMTAPLEVAVTKPQERSMLAEIIALMEVAEQSQARYVALADRLSRFYTPTVHALAALTFLGWFLVIGISWQVALLYAATVLIITCPCALGLAVPVVQVLASGKLMRQGILLKSGNALERLANITHAVFDKTGTLTRGKPELLHPEHYTKEELQLAASLAAKSKHPLSQALTRMFNGPLLSLSVQEIPGHGLEAVSDKGVIRLGKQSWCGEENSKQDTSLTLWLAVPGEKPVLFCFQDQLREDAKNVVSTLKTAGIHTVMLSGDRPEVVRHMAAEVGIEQAEASLTPLEKSERLTQLKQENAQILMVGDGLNDAPSLAVATVSMSPASAIDITQNAADIVFQGEKLASVVEAWKVALFSQVLVKQNFLLAILYNVIAVPLSMTGHVTPLVAAIAMSSSSLLVIANAMRLHFMRGK